jgi:hypothetical protein
MKTRLIATFMIGLFLGVAAMVYLALPSPQAQAQGKAKQWEYQVETFHSALGGKFPERLNKMADEGWEYAGVLCNITSPGAGEGHVAFKRLKK